MNNFKKSLIFIIFTILCPAKTVFSMPVRDLIVGGGIVLSSPLLIYKLLRHNRLKNELEQDKEELLDATTSEEKRFLKKEITRKEKELLVRGKTLSRIAAIAGSAATFILSDLLWRRGPVPTKILGCCAGGFLFYKIKMHSMFGKKLKELKSVLEETKSSREKAFLKIEIKQLERAIFSRKATIIITTIGSLLALPLVHKKHGFFRSTWDNLMASFQQPVPPPPPPPAEPPLWFFPPREVFSGAPTTPECFKTLAGHENDTEKLEREIESNKKRIETLEKITNPSTSNKEELEKLKKYDAYITKLDEDAMKEAIEICPISREAFNKKFPNDDICIPTKKAALSCGHPISLSSAKIIWDRDKQCPVCRKDIITVILLF